MPNPQEAGIALIERYPWSSFAEYLRAYDNDMTRGFSDPSCVLELFGSAKAFIAYSLSDARQRRASAVRYERDGVGMPRLCRKVGEGARGSAPRG